MGGSYNAMTIKGDRKTVQEKFEQIQDQDRYENGHSYSGGFGMAEGLSFPAKTFASKAEAYEWVVEEAEKWGPAIAVRLMTDKPDEERWYIGAWCSS